MKRTCWWTRAFNRQIRIMHKLGVDLIKSDNDGFADGKINGYYFRIFTEAEKPRGRAWAYTLIKDELAKDSIWPAFYTKKQLKKWMRLHPGK